MDESADIDCALDVRPAPGGSTDSLEALVGRVLRGEVQINGHRGAEPELPALGWAGEVLRDLRLSAFIHVSLPAGALPPGEYNVSFRILPVPGVPRILPVPGIPELSASIGITIQERGAEAVEDTYPEFPESGILSRTIRAAPSSPEAWRHLRARLFAPPFLLTQPELVLLALSSPTFFGHANTPEFRALFPRAPRLSRFKSCAVVGSAGHLRHSGLGREVDRHEAVVRINNAPTLGFAEDVGSRTTHRFDSPRVNNILYPRAVGGETVFWFLYDERGLGMYLAFPEHDRGFIVSNAWVHSAWRYVGSSDSHKTPTSGFMAILWALESCDEVRTFGFGRHPRSQPGAGHNGSKGARNLEAYKYYTDASNQQGSYGHKWSVEDSLHDEMEKAGLLMRRFD